MPTTRDAVLAKNPIAFLRLNDAASPAVDATGLGHDGTLSGGVTPGMPGPSADGATAMFFDGVAGTKVQFDLPEDLASPYTLEVWFKVLPEDAPPASVYYVLLEAPNGSNFTINPANDSLAGPNALTWWNSAVRPVGVQQSHWHDGAWHQALVVADADGQGSIWADGVAGAARVMGTNSLGAGTWAIGNVKADRNVATRGAIANVAIYDHALTADEIWDNWLAAHTAPIAGVVGVPSSATLQRRKLPTPTYTYRCFDKVSMKELGHLEDMTGVGFNSLLKDNGRLNGDVPRDAKLTFSPEPQTTRLVVDRNHVVVWDGVVTSYDFQASATARRLQAQEWPWLLKRRRFYQGMTGDYTYTNQDQFEIARNLITYTQGLAGGDLHIDLQGGNSGVARTVTYKLQDVKAIWDMLLDLSNLDSQGFDFAFWPHYVGDRELRTLLRLGYPRLGVPKSGYGFEYPGNARDYSWPSDGTDETTTLIGTGTAAGTSEQLRSVQSEDWLLGVVGLLEDTRSFNDVADQAGLDAKTLAALKAVIYPETNPVIWQEPGSWPELGAIQLGDDIRFRATSPRHPRQPNGGPGLDQWLRVLGVDVTPPNKGAPEDVKWTLGALPTDTPVIRHTSRDLQGLGRILAGLGNRLERLEVR